MPASSRNFGDSWPGTTLWPGFVDISAVAWAIIVLAIGWFTAIAPLALAGAILVAHVGMDRSLGYGLKLPTDFRDTHLGRIGRG